MRSETDQTVTDRRRIGNSLVWNRVATISLQTATELSRLNDFPFSLVFHSFFPSSISVFIRSLCLLPLCFICFILSDKIFEGRDRDLPLQRNQFQQRCMLIPKYISVLCWFCLVAKWLILIAFVMTSFAVDQQTRCQANQDIDTAKRV